LEKPLYRFKRVKDGNFKCSDFDIEDKPRSGQPIDTIRVIVAANPQISTEEL